MQILLLTNEEQQECCRHKHLQGRVLLLFFQKHTTSVWARTGASRVPAECLHLRIKISSCLARPVVLQTSTDLHCTNCLVQQRCNWCARISHQITDEHCPVNAMIKMAFSSFPRNSYLGSFSNKLVWSMILFTLSFNTYADKIYQNCFYTVENCIFTYLTFKSNFLCIKHCEKPKAAIARRVFGTYHIEYSAHHGS